MSARIRWNPLMWSTLAAVLLVGSPGCCTTSGHHPLTKEIAVAVTVGSGEHDKPMPSLDPIVLHVERQERAHWFLVGEGTLEIALKKDTPFETPLEHAGNHVRSPKPKKGSARKEPYYYSITVTLKNGQKRVYDPEIVIEQ